MQVKQKEDRSFAVHGNNPPAKVIRRKLSWVNRFIVNEEKTTPKETINLPVIPHRTQEHSGKCYLSY
jgi:hypothetical protein